MSDRLLFQSEAEQLVLERGLGLAEPEVPSFRFLGPLESRVDLSEKIKLNFLLIIKKNMSSGGTLEMSDVFRSDFYINFCSEIFCQSM